MRAAPDDRSQELKAAMRKANKIRFYNGRKTNAEQFKKCIGIISQDPESVLAFDLQVWLKPSTQAK